MKLVSRNIAIRETNNNGVIDFLRQQNADIVCLQEVGKGEEKSVKSEYDSFHAIQNTNLYPYWFIGESHEFKGFNTRNIDFWGYMRQWNVILSKYPIIKAENIFYHRQFERRDDFTTRTQTDHGRMLTKVIVHIDGSDVQVYNVHGIRTGDKKWDERTTKQCEFIISKAQEHNLPTIIAGDFNLLPDTEGIQIMNKTFQNNISRFNIISTRPSFDDWLDKWDLVVDYVFSKDVEIKDCYITNIDTSDHLPLIIEF